jgi:uncharacterized protein (DUF697 family)
MPRLSEFTSIWNTIKEVDLRPLRSEAQRGVKIALVGRQGSGKRLLASQMRRDPQREVNETMTPLLVVDLESGEQSLHQVLYADLIILLIPASLVDSQRERLLIKTWVDRSKKVLVFLNTASPIASENQVLEVSNQQSVISLEGWGLRRVIFGNVDDSSYLTEKFVPEVIDLLPDQLLALGRNFPLFRVPICRLLINETCFSNATYAFSTGLAEIIPVLDIPLNVADTFVLTKTQAFLVYKLGLVLGLSTRWQDYVREFGGVLGSGFFWRQIARQLVGLIPAWGIVPKVAVSYAGTYVVGHVVLQWYLTGRYITGKQIRQLYSQAFEQGKNLARTFIQRLPKPVRQRENRQLLPSKKKKQVCPACGKINAPFALFCQYCGNSLSSSE